MDVSGSSCKGSIGVVGDSMGGGGSSVCEGSSSRIIVVVVVIVAVVVIVEVAVTVLGVPCSSW